MVKENTEEAKSLYRQLKNGKSIIDFTPAEQEVLNDPDILTKEIRAEVDSETILPPLVSISPFAGIETGENAIEIEQQPLVKTGEVSIMTDALDGYAKYSGLSPEMKTYIVNNLTAEDLQALYSGLSPRSPQFVDLNSKIQNIINGSVGTVNSTSLTPATNLIDLEEAKQNLARILPAYIPVKDIDILLGNINNKGETWGAFSDRAIYLSTNAEVGTEYHEAFHAVYRMLLTDGQVNTYLKQAKNKWGNPSTQELKDLRESSSAYSNLTPKELNALWYEEKMANEFKVYQVSKPAESVFTKLYNKIANWIKFVALNQESLEGLFYNINRGTFKDAKQQFNSLDKQQPAFEIYIKSNTTIDGTVHPIPYTARESRIITATVAAKIQKLMDSTVGMKFPTALNQVIKEQADFYSLTHNKFLEEYWRRS